MRYSLAAGAAVLLLFAVACSDAPHSPDPLAVNAPLTSHANGTELTYEDWQPGNCTNSGTALPIFWAHDTTAARAADENGNGAMCLAVDMWTLEETYDDDVFSCGDGEGWVFIGEEGHPIDEPVSTTDPRYNAVLCVNWTSGIAFDDCTSDSESSQGGGGTGGGGGTIGGGDDGTVGGGGETCIGGICFDASPASTAAAQTCNRPAEYDDYEDAECPAGFGLPFVYDDEADANGNGLVCWSDGTFADDVTGLTLTDGRVNGHGVYDADGSTLSFSFHARSDGASVKGNFEFHDRTSGVAYHGDVTCLEADGATVHMEGVVTNGKRSSVAEGTVVTWTATDNGEGRKAPADEVSAPGTHGAFTDACTVRPTGTPVAIRGGNIQVR